MKCTNLYLTWVGARDACGSKNGWTAIGHKYYPAQLVPRMPRQAKSSICMHSSWLPYLDKPDRLIIRVFLINIVSNSEFSIGQAQQKMKPNT